MVEKIVESQVLFYFAGVTILLGVVIKVIAGISLKRLVKAAGNMSKSNHALMRLVRAKFEHACMVSDKVQNVQAFVEKYLYEYKVLGVRLFTLRQIEKTMIWLCGIVSLLGGLLSYYKGTDMRIIQSYAVLGGTGIVFLVLLQITDNENNKMQIVKMYMVDFLENTYAHRYEKTLKNETQPEVAKEPVKEPEIQPVQPPKKPVTPPADPEMQPVQAAKIREILEEFLA